MSALPIAEAARSLGVRPGTLRRWASEPGFPIAQKGQRGRGCALLVDPDAVRRWCRADGQDALLLELAQVLPALLAAAAEGAFHLVDGPHKRGTAGVLAAAWFVGATAVLDSLRARCPSVPEVRTIPAPIERLQKIAKSL